MIEPEPRTPSQPDLIAIIRAKDDLICQLKTAALETDRLRDRVEQLEQLVGVDRSLTSRLRTAARPDHQGAEGDAGHIEPPDRGTGEVRRQDRGQASA